MSITNHAFGIWPLDCPKLAINWKNNNDVTICCNYAIVKLFFNVSVFLLSILVTDPKFMSISLLVLVLWQFLFIRDWPEIQKFEIPSSEFYPKSQVCGELGTLNLTRISPMKSYWMLQNARVTAFTVSE